MKCILHIGTPKTATTLLQKWLYENKDALSDQSVALTRTFRTSNNRFLATIFQDKIDKIGRMKGFYDQEGRNHFKAVLTKRFKIEFDQLCKRHHTIIFTSEHLYRNLKNVEELRALKEWLLQWFDEIQLICYVREQGSLLKSRYSNKMKGGLTDDMLSFAKHIDDNYSFYNYLLAFQKWESVFGKDALTLRIYDQDRFVEGDIRLDFLHSILPNFDKSKLTFQSHIENQSLTNRQAIFARAVNQAFVRSLDGVPISWVRNIKKHLFNLELLKSGGGFSYPGQKDLHQQMNTSNVAFFERYFGENKNLFKAPEIDIITDTKDNYSVDEALQIVQTICETKGLIVVTDKEVKQLSHLTNRLIESNNVTNKEALVLLEIIQKCLPTSIELSKEIVRIRKKEFATFSSEG